MVAFIYAAIVLGVLLYARSPFWTVDSVLLAPWRWVVVLISVVIIIRLFKKGMDEI